MYLNHPLLNPGRGNPYGDTPAPKVFGNVSPLDPQLFSRINDFADELLIGEQSGKYSPLEVAQWTDHLADAALKYLIESAGQVPDKQLADYLRLAADVLMHAVLRRLFSVELRH